MIEHNLDLIKLENDFENSYYEIEQSIFTTNNRELVLEKLMDVYNKIDQYFVDLKLIYDDEDVVGRRFYDFYHRYFSSEISDKLKDDIANGNAPVEKAIISYVEYGYRVISKNDLPSDFDFNSLNCNAWTDNCTFPIIIDKNIYRELSNNTLSLVKLSSTKFYNSEEDYIGDYIKGSLDKETIEERMNESKGFFIDKIKLLSNKNGINLENELNALSNIANSENNCLKKHL